MLKAIRVNKSHSSHGSGFHTLYTVGQGRQTYNQIDALYTFFLLRHRGGDEWLMYGWYGGVVGDTVETKTCLGGRIFWGPIISGQKYVTRRKCINLCALLKQQAWYNIERITLKYSRDRRPNKTIIATKKKADRCEKKTT